MTIKVFSMIFISVIYLFVAWVHHQTAHDNWQVAHGTKIPPILSASTNTASGMAKAKRAYLTRCGICPRKSWPFGSSTRR